MDFTFRSIKYLVNDYEVEENSFVSRSLRLKILLIVHYRVSDGRLWLRVSIECFILLLSRSPVVHLSRCRFVVKVPSGMRLLLSSFTTCANDYYYYHWASLSITSCSFSLSLGSFEGEICPRSCPRKNGASVPNALNISNWSFINVRLLSEDYKAKKISTGAVYAWDRLIWSEIWNS